MSLFKICKGAETNLPQTLTNGYCYFCTDTTNFYIDYTDTYGALTRSKISAKYADKLRYTEDGNFVEIEPTDVLTKNNYETAIGVAATDKNGLMSSGDKTKLDGIADGAGTDDIKYVVQDLTEEQKRIARENIGTARIKTVYYWDNSDGNDIRSIVSGNEGFGVVKNGDGSTNATNVTIDGGTMSFPAFVICGSINYTSQNFSVIDNDGQFWSGNIHLPSGTGAVRLISKDETMVVNITKTSDSDGNTIYTADKTSQEIASAVVNDKKNVVAYYADNGEMVFNCYHAVLTDTTYESDFICFDRNLNLYRTITIRNDGATDDIVEIGLSSTEFVVKVTVSKVDDQGNKTYRSNYRFELIMMYIFELRIVPVCQFYIDDSTTTYGTLSKIYFAGDTPEQDYVQFTSPDGSDCGVYYVNIYADNHIEVGKTSIPTYTDATTTESGLMSSSDKSKLDGIANGANNYTHPTYTSKSSGLYKVAIDATGHVSAAEAISKSDITDLGIPSQDTTYSVATNSENGLMSSTDKAKLDSFATGIWYGTCTTAAATADKVVTTSTGNFVLEAGSTVYVQFNTAVTSTATTLNVDNTGAIAVQTSAVNALSAYQIAPKVVVGFVYDGTVYRMLDSTIATTTYYGVTKLSSSTNSTSTIMAATPSAVKEAYDLANTANTAVNNTETWTFTLSDGTTVTKQVVVK